jgi:hypothetical protein
MEEFIDLLDQVTAVNSMKDSCEKANVGISIRTLWEPMKELCYFTDQVSAVKKPTYGSVSTLSRNRWKNLLTYSILYKCNSIG